MSTPSHDAPPIEAGIFLQHSGADAPERSLDPTDWTATRAVGHRMVDDMIDFLAGVRDRPTWRRPDDEARACFDREAPREGEPLDVVYERFRRHVLPYSLGNTHPRFWGWVNGTGTATGMFADMLAGAMNGHVSFGDTSPVHVERQVIRWLVELMGFPPDSSGLLVSSGSVANLTGLTVARDAMLPDVIQHGVRALDRMPTVYASDQVHNSVDKMLGVLGLGRGSLRRVPARDDFTCDVDALAAAIAKDRASGHQPFCIVGTAGTVDTGAVDDLSALADLAAREGMWLHVDAAFGAALALSPRLRGLLRGLERADSVAFDLHKWFYMQYDVGCTIVRDARAHQRSFSPPANYLGRMERGVTSGGHPFGEYGVDLSRGFRALKVWMCLQEHGVERYGAQVEQNVEQGAYLASLVRARPELELLAPVSLNVVCFRHRPPGAADGEALDAHNRAILGELHERGIAVPSFTRVRGAFAIRAAITNHRSRREDFEMLVDAVCAMGGELGVVSGE